MSLGKRLWLISVLLCLTVVLSSCSSGVRLGWMGSDSPSSMQARYAHWNGTKQMTITLEKNNVLEVVYDANVKKGSLLVEVLTPAGEILHAITLGQDAREKLQLTAVEAGKYLVRVVGEGTGGGFSVAWTRIQP